jgi:hypothetical protein
MRRMVWSGAGMLFALIGAATAAAAAPAKHAAAKGPPACSMLTFRAVATGAADGDQQAGYYRSRYGTLALHANVKGGQPQDYFVLADGKKLSAAPTPLPSWASECAAAKKMPKPEAAATAPCAGQRFRVVLAHDAATRLALLYGYDGSAWHFCTAGGY